MPSSRYDQDSNAIEEANDESTSGEEECRGSHGKGSGKCSRCGCFNEKWRHNRRSQCNFHHGKGKRSRIQSRSGCKRSTSSHGERNCNRRREARSFFQSFRGDGIFHFRSQDGGHFGTSRCGLEATRPSSVRRGQSDDCNDSIFRRVVLFVLCHDLGGQRGQNGRRASPAGSVRNRPPHRPTRRSSGLVQGVDRRIHGNRPKNGHSLRQFRILSRRFGRMV
mmetsp:Transcript_22144/g.44945  ORF Transcript_22144/g.44945 Transcript_22144/m.44945 type:complete len:221 (-) Transcript_22144:846-1508(-)